jgi:signal transduction histidine kinase
MDIVKLMKTWVRRSSFRGLSIQQRLPLLICVLLMSIIIVFSWVSYIGVKNAAIKTGKERLRSLTGQLSTMLSQSSLALINTTRATANQEPIKNYLKAAQPDSQAQALNVIQMLRVDTTSVLVDLLNKHRTVVLRSGKGGIASRVNFDSLMAEFSYQDTAAAVGKIYLVKDSMYYPITATITDNKEILGYMVRWRKLSATPRAIEQFSQLIGAGATLYIGNNDRSVWTDMIKPVSNPIPEDTTLAHDVFEYAGKGKASFLASSKSIASTPWLVMVEFSQQVVLESASRFLQRIIIVGAILIVIGILLAWIMSRNIIRPLNHLTAAATAIAGGDYSSAVNVDRRDEVGKLARAFNAMNSQVSRAKKGLEQKIAETIEINEQLRDLSAHLQNIREEERIHIAREMHDELGQLLTGFKMDVSWLKKRLAGNSDPAILEKLEGMVIITDEAVRFVRKIAAELRPSILDDLGLIPALEWHNREFEKRYNIQVEFQSHVQDLKIPSTIATGIFRMYQESLTNVARHSGAKKVSAILDATDENIHISIADDGKGFDIGRAERKTLGLLGMKERAIMIGGTLEIKSEPGRGTTILITIPLAVMIPDARY